MENLKKELSQSISEIRSRYEDDCKQFTIDLFDDMEDRIEGMDEIGVDTTIGSMCYAVSTTFEAIDPSIVDSLAVRDLNKMLEQYYNQHVK